MSEVSARARELMDAYESASMRYADFDPKNERFDEMKTIVAAEKALLVSKTTLAEYVGQLESVERAARYVVANQPPSLLGRDELRAALAALPGTAK